MRRAYSRAWIGALVGIVILAACGGGSTSHQETALPDTPVPNGSATPYVFTGPTATPRPSAPRNRDVPEATPYDLTVPFTVGAFVQQHVRGHATGLATGGLQATYVAGQDTLVLTVYYVDDSEQAINAVRGAVESSSVARVVEPPHYLSPVAYGIVQDHQGGYTAAWSHYNWVFIIRTPTSLDALQRFMEAFPY